MSDFLQKWKERLKMSSARCKEIKPGKIKITLVGKQNRRMEIIGAYRRVFEQGWKWREMESGNIK